MLHLQYVPKDYYDPDIRIQRLGDRHDIQHTFCDILERSYDLAGRDKREEDARNPLRSKLICRFLREAWDVEWAGNFTILANTLGEKGIHFATWLSYDLQATMLLLYYHEHGGVPVMLNHFSPYIKNLAWVSRNLEMTVYVSLSEETEIPCDSKEENEKLYHTKGLFDFIFQETHYSCSCCHFQLFLLDEYHRQQKVLTKKKENAFFTKYLREELHSSGEKQTLSLAEFVALTQNSAFPLPEWRREELDALGIRITCDRNASLIYRPWIRNYHLYLILKKGKRYHLRETTSFKNPTLEELIVHYCIGDREGEGAEIPDWAEEVLLFLNDSADESGDERFYQKKNYGACIHYKKAKKQLFLYSRPEGLAIFHQWYQRAEPLR